MEALRGLGTVVHSLADMLEDCHLGGRENESMKIRLEKALEQRSKDAASRLTVDVLDHPFPSVVGCYRYEAASFYEAKTGAS